jgi:hypothetical protein
VDKHVNVYTMLRIEFPDNQMRWQPLTRINFQIWLTGDDAERYRQICERAYERQSRARISDINRRLLGLDQDSDLLTKEEVLFFQGAKSGLSEFPPLARGGTPARSSGKHALKMTVVKDLPPKENSKKNVK